MPRSVAAGRADYNAPPAAAKRNYPVTGPWSQEDVVRWLMARDTPADAWPRWRAVAATAIAIAMRSNSEPITGGLVIIRVVPGGFELEEQTRRA